MKNKKFLVGTFTVVLGTIISKLSGFGKEIVLAFVYGSSYEVDAFILANSIPLSIFFAIGSSIITAYVPIFSDVLNKNGKKRADLFTNNIITYTTIIAIVIVLFGLIFASEIISIIAFGFDEKTSILATQLLRIIFPSLVLLILSQFISGYLQNNGRPIITSFVNIPSNVLVIFTILFLPKFGIIGVEVAFLFGYLLQVIIQIPVLYKLRFKPKISFAVHDEYVSRLIRLMIPIMIGYLTFQINTLFDKSLASTLVEGTVANMNYAIKVNQFVYGVISVSLSIIVFPKLSKLIAMNKKEEYKRLMEEMIFILVFLILPIVIYVVTFSDSFITVLFERGNFLTESTHITSNLLKLYIFGLLGVALKDILNKGFYAIHDSKTPMIISIGTILLNIILNLLLIKTHHQYGLAFATSFSSIVSAILLYNRLSKELKWSNGKIILRLMYQALIAIVLVIIVVIISKLLSFSDIVIVLLSIVYFVLYIMVCWKLLVSKYKAIKEIFNEN